MNFNWINQLEWKFTATFERYLMDQMNELLYPWRRRGINCSYQPKIICLWIQLLPPNFNKLGKYLELTNEMDNPLLGWKWGCRLIPYVEITSHFQQHIAEKIYALPVNMNCSSKMSYVMALDRLIPWVQPRQKTPIYLGEQGINQIVINMSFWKSHTYA